MSPAGLALWFSQARHLCMAIDVDVTERGLESTFSIVVMMTLMVVCTSTVDVHGCDCVNRIGAWRLRDPVLAISSDCCAVVGLRNSDLQFDTAR